jgi:ribonuclease HI
MMPDSIYCDGGLIGNNPSSLGGTWTWLWVKSKQVVKMKSGVIEPGDLEQSHITNNDTELMAALRALESCPGFTGTLYTDSLVTVRRLLSVPRPHIPGWCRERVFELRTLKDRGVSWGIVLLGGHPTRKELQQGFKNKNKLPVSMYNVLCDKRCTELAREYKARRK